MVATFDNVQKVWRFHFGAHPLKEVQRAKWIARALHKQGWGIQAAQNFIAEFCLITHRAKRVAEANKSLNVFFERHVASDAAAHAFADENCQRGGMSFSRLAQCFSVPRDQLWQRIGPFPAFSGVVIIESLDLPNLAQTIFPILHPSVR